MNFPKLLIALVLLTLICNTMHAQVSSCANADFEQNSFAGWTGTTGSCCPINSTTPGLVPGRHTIMTGGTDPVCNNLLNCVAPGGSYSVRLGNANIGAEAEQLKYTFLVTPQTQLFLYRYAVVLEDPGHLPPEQPRFEISVYDQNGTIDPICGFYSVVAAAGIPGFNTIQSSVAGGIIHYKDWTTVGIDLSNKMGSTITIEFSTGDCDLGGHFGYAYIDCMCYPFNVSADFCPGNFTATLTAPPGFVSYVWSTGQTTPSITIINPMVGDTFTVTMTSVTGCQVTLNSVLQESIVASSYNFTDTCYNRTTFSDSSYVVTGTPITGWLWQFGDGGSSTLQNPTHAYTAPGTYNVQLIITNDGGCADTISQPVTLRDIPHPGFVTGSVCPGSLMQFTDTSAIVPPSVITTWQWDFGDGSPSVSGQNPTHIFNLSGTYNVQLIAIDNSGCRDTVVAPVSTNTLPVAVFIPPSGCPGTSLPFQSTSSISTGVIDSVIWDFGDGTTIKGNNVTHVYATSGLYNAILYAYSNAGCMDSVVHQVNIYLQSSADFISDTVCFGNSTLFSDVTPSVPATIVAWQWSFGDGTTSTIQNPVHAYTNDSTYLVTLIVTDINTCTDTIQEQVIVNPLPVTAYTTTNPCVNKLTQFINFASSAAGIQSMTWSFGDGGTSGGANPVHLYSTTGTYTTQLLVIDNNGCADSTQVLVTVKPLPVASFSLFNCCPGVPIQMNDQSAYPAGGAGSWFWDMGNTHTDTVVNPVYIFPATGNYNIVFSVTADNGCSDDTSMQIIIHPAPVVQFTALQACEQHPMQFHDNSIVTPGNISSRTWDFGDNSDDFVSDPQHIYSSFGVYQVKLTVVTDSGCFSSLTKPVVAHPLPLPEFSSDTVCAGLPTSLISLSSVDSGSIAGYYWNFGDGNSGSGSDINHIYTLPGIYMAQLIPTTGVGCDDSVFHPVKVYELPVALFASDVTGGCQPLQVSFRDQSTSNEGNIISWFWDFGNGDNDSIQSPPYLYNEAGLFDVSLTVVTDLSCVDAITKPGYINVHPKPEADFTFTPEHPDILQPVVYFTDHTINGDHWIYDFGDMTFSNDINPLHEYAIGNYQIIQYVTTDFGCADTSYRTIELVGAFTLYIPNAFTPNGDGKNDRFNAMGIGVTDFNIHIFDRWGQPVFESSEMEMQWDGKTNNEQAGEQVYYYVVKARDIFKTDHVMNGRITVVY